MSFLNLGFRFQQLKLSHQLGVIGLEVLDNGSRRISRLGIPVLYKRSLKMSRYTNLIQNHVTLYVCRARRPSDLA